MPPSATALAAATLVSKSYLACVLPMSGSPSLPTARYVSCHFRTALAGMPGLLATDSRPPALVEHPGGQLPGRSVVPASWADGHGKASHLSDFYFHVQEMGGSSNPLLSNAMSKTGMIDQNAIGIRNVFDIQRNRLLPMPTYDLATPRWVSVTLYGTVLDESYLRLLAQDRHLDLETVVLLGMVQKGIPITKDQSRMLHQRKLARGRYPKLTISASVTAATGTHGDYVRSKGVDNRVFKELVLELLRVRPCTQAEIIAELDHALPGDLSTR